MSLSLSLSFLRPFAVSSLYHSPVRNGVYVPHTNGGTDVP